MTVTLFIPALKGLMAPQNRLIASYDRLYKFAFEQDRLMRLIP